MSLKFFQNIFRLLGAVGTIILLSGFLFFKYNDNIYANEVEGYWAANGETCENAKMYFVITDERVFALVPGFSMTKIADVNKITSDGIDAKIFMSRKKTEVWHMKINKSKSGKITKQYVDGKMVTMTQKQKNMLNMSKCNNLPYLF